MDMKDYESDNPSAREPREEVTEQLPSSQPQKTTPLPTQAPSAPESQSATPAQQAQPTSAATTTPHSSTSPSTNHTPVAQPPNAQVPAADTSVPQATSHPYAAYSSPQSAASYYGQTAATGATAASTTAAFTSHNQPSYQAPVYGQASLYAQNQAYGQGGAYSQTQPYTQRQVYYQPWETPPAPAKGKWSTAALGLIAALSLIVGTFAGGALGMTLGPKLGIGQESQPQQIDEGYGQNGNGWDALPDYGNGSYGEDGFDPFFPDHSEDMDTGTKAEAAPGVLIINSMLTNGIGAGSGIILSEDGYAVTNYHVVEGSTQVQVEVADSGQNYTAQVLGHNAEVDVALLKLEDASGLTPLEFETKAVKKGTAVYALGNGGGQGYISRVDGEVTRVNTRIVAQSEMEAKELTGLIETDADIVQGYSGGPLLNEDGKVVGMTVAASMSSFTSSNDTDGYAIPTETVLEVVEQIKSGKSSDSTIVGRNAALGVIVGTSDQMHGTTVSGATVLQVNPGSAAEKAGIQAGDTITEVNGTKISTSAELSQFIKTFAIGDTITVKLTTQSGEQKELSIDLGESPVN